MVISMLRGSAPGPKVGSRFNPVAHRLVLAGVLVISATSLSGCGMLDWGAQFAPTPSQYTPHSTASALPTPSLTPSATPSKAATAVATGSMALYKNVVTTKLVGTCTMGEQPIFTLADPKNEFFQTVDLAVVLDTDTGQVTSMSAVFGEDQEEITREIVYTSINPVKGTSAVLKTSGKKYQISGTAQAVEDDRGTKSSRLLPFAVTINCEAKA